MSRRPIRRQPIGPPKLLIDPPVVVSHLRKHRRIVRHATVDPERQNSHQLSVAEQPGSQISVARRCIVRRGRVASADHPVANAAGVHRRLVAQVTIVDVHRQEALKDVHRSVSSVRSRSPAGELALLAWRGYSGSAPGPVQGVGRGFEGTVEAQNGQVMFAGEHVELRVDKDLRDAASLTAGSNRGQRHISGHDGQPVGINEAVLVVQDTLGRG